MTFYIDDIKIELKQNTQISILEACKLIGIDLPRFCYHETLSVAGNCRMCLVEIEEGEKPVASCVTEMNNGMSVYTNSAFVQKARENVVEALLLNHPLDCPICDQAGECDLQDQAKNFGSVNSRFFYDKKGVEDKYCGPLIKTIMTRCISCTRCVRYSTEITGVNFFGTLNRGRDTEIGSYVSDFFDSEISGNVVDLCPVGALTSKPYAFKSRSWELRIAETVDLTDSSGSSIYVNYKGNRIYRIIPKNNELINDSIISDRTRFVYDSNNSNRIVYPYVYDNINKKYEKSSWELYLEILEDDAEKSSIIFIIDEKTDFTDAFALKTLSHVRPDKIILASIETKKYENFNLNFEEMSLTDKIKKANDLIILLGLNSRNEMPVFNVKIRNKNKNQFLNVFLSGYYYNQNIGGSFLNLNINEIFKLFDGKSYQTLKLYFSKNPLIILGQAIQSRINYSLSIFSDIKNHIKTLQIFTIKDKANTAGLKTLGIKPFLVKEKNSTTVVYNINDSIQNNRYLKESHIKLEKTFWFNTHGSKTAMKYGTILPNSTSFEREKIYLNTEYRPQQTSKIVSNSENISFSFTLNIFNKIYKLRNKLDMTQQSTFRYLKEMILKEFRYTTLSSQNFEIIKLSTITLRTTQFNSLFVIKYPMFEKNKNFYANNNASRNSGTLTLAHKEFLSKTTNFLLLK